MYQEEPNVGSDRPEFPGDAAQQFQDALGTAEEFASKNVKRAMDVIKKHPVESVAIGFGVGCLIGAWLSRRQ